MATRSGGTSIRTRKVEPGPDQAFTLPKGTSAAPIMQVKVKPKPKSKKAKKTFEGELRKKLLKKKAKEELEALSFIGAPPILAVGLAQYESRKEKRKKQKKQRTESRKKQRGMSFGGSVNSRAIAKKYFRGGLV